MGKIRSGILGILTGKVAGVVGGTWKNVNYLRAYVIPANPKTAGQVTQREKFSRTVNFCKPLVGPIFNVFTDQFQKAMSGFNFFIKSNLQHFIATPTFSSVKVTEGKLFTAKILNRVTTAATDDVAWESNVDLGANGKDTDQLNAAAYNADTDIWSFLGTPYQRDQGATTQHITLAMDAGDNVILYLYTAQFIGTILDIIGDSDVWEGTA